VPRVLIIAGPNGAGKTTFAKEFLPNEGALRQFVNADLIAQGISPFAPDTADVAAGRAMLARLDELSGSGVDFALETTLSGRWLLGHISKWRAMGYSVVLLYLQLSDPELAISRVANRVSLGGHHIPEDVILRSLELRDSVYKGAVDRWFVYDNDFSATLLIQSGPEETA